MLKCTKFDFRWGSAPDPVAGFKAPLLKVGRRKWREGEGWRVEEKMRALLLRKRKEGSGRRGRKGRGRDLPDQCQTASYTPEPRVVKSVPR